MSTKNRKIYLLFAYLFLISTLTVGCDKITKIFTGEDTDDGIENSAVTTKQLKNLKNKTVVMPTDGIVRINDWVLTKSDFQDRLKALEKVLPNFDVTNKEARRLVLDEIISQQLIVIDAKSKGMDKQKEIAAAVDEFEKTLLVRENAQQLVKDSKVTDEDAKAFYDANPDNFKAQEEWRLREIVVENQLKANELLLNIMKGGDFADIARKNSISETASNGGDVGFVYNLPFFEMANALASLGVGDVSNVFKGPNGYYVVKVEEKRGGLLRSYDEVKEQLQKELMILEQQKAILAYINKLKEIADIEINDENIE